LLFEYHRYHHDAIVRVYAGDRLVDEISLSRDINIKTINNVGMPNLFIGPSNVTPVMFVPEKLFLFEIDERQLRDCIRIEVQNNHNNYNNGFMTKFSYLKFHEIYLLPRCLLEQDNWQKLDRRLGHPNFKSYKSTSFPHNILAREITFKPKLIHDDSEWNGHVLGGSFSMEIPTSRKHGLIHLGRSTPGRIEVSEIVSWTLWSFNLLNKFNEDQRSNRTKD
jgi:hypothetical protein